MRGIPQESLESTALWGMTFFSVESLGSQGASSALVTGGLSQ